jgi:hypothetical protein
MHMVKTRTWICVIVLLLAICVGAAIWLSGRSAAGRVANVYVDGECVYSVDLSTVTKEFDVPIDNERGANVLHIEPGKLCVSEADCPDQVCVEAGWLTDSAAPIVCLPHRLVVRLEDSAAQDDTMKIDAVAQ